MSVPLPTNESGRLAALARYGVLDTPPEEAFDRITQLTTQVLDVPYAAVNFVDAGRQFTKSCQGLGLAGVSLAREATPCAWAILSSGLLLIEDLAADPRFADHPLVGPASGAGLRMYAGMPLVTAGGEALGTLCVLDTRVRRLDPREQDILRSLAALVLDELELRLKTQELARAQGHARTLRDLAGLTNEALAPEDLARRALTLLHRRLPLDWSGLLRLTPHGPQVLCDHAGERGEALRAVVRQHSSGGSSGERPCPALECREPLFLDGGAIAETFPPLRQAGLGSAAWLPLRGGACGLALARLECSAAWTPEERLLLAAAAHSLSVALERADFLPLEHAALTDPLTGLGNRRALHQALEEADRQRAGAGSGYVLGVVDLDGLKRVNDDYGHARGDHLLREFARQLHRPGLHGPGVTAYRLGGDEYALLHLCPDLPEVAAQDLVTLVASAVQALRRLGYSTEASLGVACVPDDAPGGAGALRAADRRMYARKRERRAARHGR